MRVEQQKASGLVGHRLLSADNTTSELVISSTTAATTTTNLKSSTNDEDGIEATTTTTFTSEQLQQLFIELLPYNQQMKTEQKDQQQQEDDDEEVGDRLIIVDENEDGVEEMTEKTTVYQNERENASLVDARLHQILNKQKHLMGDEQLPVAGPSTSAVVDDGDAESLNANLVHQNGQTFPELLRKTAAKRKLHQTQTRKRPNKQGGGKNNIGNQNSLNNQQKALLNKKNKSTTTFQKDQIHLNQSPPYSQIASLPFPPNFGQQLTELFTAGLHHLLTLGGQSTIDQTNNSNNPLANISVEEIGRMVMEQMCKEIGDQAQQIIAQLAEIQPDSTQEELMNAFALTMAGQFGLIVDPNQQNSQMSGNIAANQMELCNQNQQQFWQSIQLGLAQTVMAACMNGNGEIEEKDDSGIIADTDIREEEEQVDGVIQRQEEAFGQQQLQALAECFSMAMANGVKLNLNDETIDYSESFNTMLNKKQNSENTAKKPKQKRMASKKGQSNCSTIQRKQEHNQHPSNSNHQHFFNPSFSHASSFIPTAIKNEGKHLDEQNVEDQQKRHQSCINQPQEELTKLFSNQFGGHQNDQSQLRICRPSSTQSSSTTISSSAASSAFSPSLLCNANQQQNNQQAQWDPTMGAAMAEMCQQLFQQQQSTNIGEIEQNQQMLAIQILSQMLISSQQPSNDPAAAFAAMFLNCCAQQQQLGVDPTAELLLEQQQQIFNAPHSSIPTSILAAMVDQSQQQQSKMTTTTHKPAIVPNPMFSHHQIIKSESKDEIDNNDQSKIMHLTNENRNGTGSHHFRIENKGSNPANSLMFLKREMTTTEDDHQLLDPNGNNRQKKPREVPARIGSQGASTLSANTNAPILTSTLVPGIVGTLTAKNEKSLGALLLQNPEGAERVEELKELEEFANSFKKLRIKHGFTQGDVGVALGKRYGTDFSQTTISRFEALNLSFKNMCKLRPLLQDWLTETERLLGAGATVQDVMEGIALQRVAQQAQQKDSQQPKMVLVNAEQQQNFSELMTTSQSQFLDQQQILNGMAEAIGHGGNDHKGEAMGIGGGQMIPPFKKRRKRTNLDSAQKMSLDTYFRMDPRPDNSRMNEIARILDLDQDVVRVWFCNRRQKLRKI